MFVVSIIQVISWQLNRRDSVLLATESIKKTVNTVSASVKKLNKDMDIRSPFGGSTSSLCFKH